MKRMIVEVGLCVLALLLGLEVVHYRNAVIDANIDRNRAWRTVVQLRAACEVQGIKPPEAEPPLPQRP